MQLTRLGWNRTPYRFEMQGTDNLNLLDMQTEKGRLEMQSSKPTIKIDQSQCFSEIGRKGVTDFRADNTDYGRAMLRQAVARMVDQGNRMIDIHIQADAFAEQADYNAFGMFEREFNLDFIPKSRPQITIDPWSMNYSYKAARVINNSYPRKAQFNFTYGRLDFYTY